MDKPGVGLAVIVMRKDKKVIMGKRTGSHGEGTWALPGGHLEMFEGFEECARREVKEETGLDVELVDKHPVVITNDFFPEDKKHFITLIMRAKYIGGELINMEPYKCEELGWYDWDNLPKPLFVAIQNLKKQGYNPFKDLK